MHWYLRDSGVDKLDKCMNRLLSVYLAQQQTGEKNYKAAKLLPSLISDPRLIDGCSNFDFAKNVTSFFQLHCIQFGALWMKLAEQRNFRPQDLFLSRTGSFSQDPISSFFHFEIRNLNVDSGH